MPVEIERKFLVDINQWNKADKGARHFYRQGYMLSDPEKTIRLRVTDESGFITIKGKTVSATRPEYEYIIPKRDAIELLEGFCSSIVSKFRYIVPFAGKVWEVDEFLDANEGLVIAEIELASEEEPFEKPGWIAEEVTGIEKYYNACLAVRPFREWSQGEGSGLPE